ncbi:MAG: hypothetical protein EOM52_12680 [Clostridia bacterium]|nr:hypothetical protein [Clostridia bacterium]
MAITVVIAATKDPASGAATAFTTTGPFALYGDHFGWAESAQLLRLGPSGEHLPATNKEGVVQVGAYPNVVLVDVPGTYRIDKTKTVAAASVGYEEIL